MNANAALARTFATERARLFAVGYRMTGSRSDADDIVQEAFTRLLARPPADVEAPLGPYAMRVVVNLAKDRLRARRRAPYRGPWLPQALELPEDARDERTGEAAYGTMESVTYAFLLALEGLSPSQRAVLVLRDVLDLSVAETAASMGRTETYVKVAHHRARERMATYDRSRVVPDAATLERTKDALGRFLAALSADDADALVALMTEGCVATQDANGEFAAAGRVFSGRDRIAMFHRKIRREGVPAEFRIALVNGLPTALVHFGESGPGLAVKVLFQVEIDADGRIREVRTATATGKIAGLTFPAQPWRAPENVE